MPRRAAGCGRRGERAPGSRGCHAHRPADRSAGRLRHRDIVLGMGTSAQKGMAFGKPVVIQGERGYWETLTPENMSQFLYHNFYGLGDGGDGARGWPRSSASSLAIAAAGPSWGSSAVRRRSPSSATRRRRPRHGDMRGCGRAPGQFGAPRGRSAPCGRYVRGHPCHRSRASRRGPACGTPCRCAASACFESC